MAQSTECYLQFDLQTPRGGGVAGVLLPFESLEAACTDLYAGLPDVAAELLRDGIDPLACAYLVRDERGNTLVEVDFSELLRGSPTARRASASTSDDKWLALNAELGRRSADAMERADRASARLQRLTAQALAIGTGTGDKPG